MRHFYKFLFSSLLIVTSCNKSTEPIQDIDLDMYTTLKSTTVDLPEFCNDDDVYYLTPVAECIDDLPVQINNTEEFLYITIFALEDFSIYSLRYYVGEVGMLPTYSKFMDSTGSDDPHAYIDAAAQDEFGLDDDVDDPLLNYKYVYQASTFTFMIPRPENDCFGVSLFVKYRNPNDETNVYAELIIGINDDEYCWKECGCYPYRTQTPGGWGAPANGNNPGSYRDMYFEKAFPTGLIVGGDYTLKLESASDVEAFLPSGGKAMALSSNYINPTSKQLKNVFASHIVALTLSVAFDDNDEGFSMASGYLGDLAFAAGTFEGMTVREVLEIANIVLGGGSTSYSLKDLHSAISAVNEYYVDGEWKGSGLLLDCRD